MRMIRPRLDAPQVTIAEDQEEYLTVTAALAKHPLYPLTEMAKHNSVVLAFRLSEDERRRIAEGADFYVSLLTFGGPMQPVLTAVGPDEMAGWFGVEVEQP